MRQLIVLARVENTGLEETGEMENRLGYYTPKLKRVPEAKAMVYSSDMQDMARAKEYAAREGWRLLVMDDTEDVLTRAKKEVLP